MSGLGGSGHYHEPERTSGLGVPGTLGRPTRGATFGVTDEETLAELDRLWDDGQRWLAERSTQGKLVIAESSGHAISIEQPEIAVDSIRELVDAVRARPE